MGGILSSLSRPQVTTDLWAVLDCSWVSARERESHLVLWSFVLGPHSLQATLSTTQIYLSPSFLSASASPRGPGAPRCVACTELESDSLCKSDLWSLYLDTFLSPGATLGEFGADHGLSKTFTTQG